ncbi:protein HEG homolog 1 isoform X3 [Boleophthalmus pectinirostris]|uniref:protein HEG homolog 1 isoform X3 n=1 Tax=Boleophthalmus pectinirostris TaxID=150288 RepID=UPI002430B8EF|nr:protein HEG homolog 1 isoform X3 [Boleophthalmus pectinirostris]
MIIAVTTSLYCIFSFIYTILIRICISSVASSTVVTTNSTSTRTTITPATETTVTTGTTTQSTTGGSTGTTAAPAIFCPGKPCPAESVCLNGTCACISGRYLNNGQCVKAQVVPGLLRVTKLTFSNEMSNRSSNVFQSTAGVISDELFKILKGQKGYIRSDVIKLTPGSVVATVDNIYEDTTVTAADVQKAIDQAINSSNTGLLVAATYNAGDLCQPGVLVPCDLSTTSCGVVNDQPQCTCLRGYVTLNQLYSSNTSCKACPSGQRAVDDTCKPCPFGYAGFNCNDSSLLAVVVISCVLGGVLLLLILALLAYCCWKCCCSSKSVPHFESPYSVSNTNQPWPTDITPIPRATTHWEPGPSIELTEGTSTRTLVEKNNQTNGLLNPKGWRKTGSYDLESGDMKTFKGKNTSRYSYLVQGHANPYFLPGDESKK